MIATVFRTTRKALAPVCLVLLFMAYVTAIGKDDASSAPPAIACEIRYHYRERLESAKAGGKKFSAPAYENEALPACRRVIADGQQARLIEGQVKHLPYRVAVKLARNSRSDSEKLEIKMFDSVGKPVPGFPQTIDNPFTKTAAPSEEFEIQIAPGLKQTIEKTLLAKNQYLLRVELIVKSSP